MREFNSKLDCLLKGIRMELKYKNLALMFQKKIWLWWRGTISENRDSGLEIILEIRVRFSVSHYYYISKTNINPNKFQIGQIVLLILLVCHVGIDDYFIASDELDGGISVIKSNNIQWIYIKFRLRYKYSLLSDQYRFTSWKSKLARRLTCQPILKTFIVATCSQVIKFVLMKVETLDEVSG